MLRPDEIKPVFSCCACGCGGKFLPHKNHKGELVKYLRYHHFRTAAHRKQASDVLSERNRSLRARVTSSKNAKRNISNLITYTRSARGREISAKNAKLMWRTKHEKVVARKLKFWGVRFQWNSKTFPLKGGGKGCHRVDFFLPDYNLILEIDGRTHKLDDVRDSRRDHYLRKMFKVKILRVRNKDVFSLRRVDIL